MARLSSEESKRLQRIAYNLYINTDMDFNEIADTVGVSTKTLRDWRTEGGWDDIKEASAVNNEALVAKIQKQLNHELEFGVVVFDKKTGIPFRDADGNDITRPITKDEISKAAKAINDLRDNRVLMSHRYLTLKELLYWHADKYPQHADERKRLGVVCGEFTKSKANGN